MKEEIKKIIAVDIDGFVAEGKFWEEECTPKKDIIEKINNLYKKQYVIIYHTARHPQYYGMTYAWLVKNGCYFHALEMGKLTADYYLDDRNANLEDLLPKKDGKTKI